MASKQYTDVVIDDVMEVRRLLYNKPNGFRCQGTRH